MKQLQKEMFRKAHFPRVSMNPQDANYLHICVVKLNWCVCQTLKVSIAAEGALPSPSGRTCVRLPGEIWGGSVLRYFSALEEGINLLPGFAPELQGVYIEEHDGRKQVWCYVIKQQSAQPALFERGNVMSKAKSNKMGVVQLTILTMVNMMGLRNHHVAHRALPEESVLSRSSRGW